MDCKHRIKQDDWINFFIEKEKGPINNKITYKIFDYKSLVLHITDKKFVKQIENIISKYRGKQKFYYQYFLDNIMNNYDNSYYIYLYDKNKIIGMTRAGVRKTKVELSMVFILEDYRKKGYAFNMLNKFINFLKIQKDVTKIGLSVEKENINAFNLYKKLKFNVECEKIEILIENNKECTYNMIYMFLD